MPPRRRRRESETPPTPPPMPLRPYTLLDISTDKMPQLTRDNWIEWNAILLDVLAPYEGAYDILIGVKYMGDMRYRYSTDVELLSLIHRLTSTEMRHHIRRSRPYNILRTGSAIYRILKEDYEKNPTSEREAKMQEIREQLDSIKQEERESMPKYKRRFEELVFQGQECGLVINDAIGLVHKCNEEMLVNYFKKSLNELALSELPGVMSGNNGKHAGNWELLAMFLGNWPGAPG